MKDLNKKWFTIFCIEINHKIIDPCNAKEHYKSFITKENKTSKTIKNNYLKNEN